MSLTKATLSREYPEVFTHFQLLSKYSDNPRCHEKMQGWRRVGISCYESWSVPYFLEREREKKRPCLKLNYPRDGVCGDCANKTCRYDATCFMCGKEGHGAYTIHISGKLKGSLRCTLHAKFLEQMEAIENKYQLNEEGVQEVFDAKNTKPNKATPATPASSKVPPSQVTPSVVLASPTTTTPPAATAVPTWETTKSVSSAAAANAAGTSAAAAGPTSETKSSSPPASSVFSKMEPEKAETLISLPEDEDFATHSTARFSLESASVPSPQTLSTWYRGTLTSVRSEENVSIGVLRAPMPASFPNINAELKSLRQLSMLSSKHMSKLLHSTLIDIVGAPNLCCTVWEGSALGTLDTYMLSNSGSLLPGDLQTMTVQLTDALLFLHSHQVAHRNVRPSSVLVQRGGSFESTLFADGLTLKLCDFHLTSVSTAVTHTAEPRAMFDPFLAPEGAGHGTNYGDFMADSWALGAIIFWIVTKGAHFSPFESMQHMLECMGDHTRRLACIQNVAGVHHFLAMDAVERFLRPVSNRAQIIFVRTHPWYWGIDSQYHVLNDITNSLYSSIAPNEFGLQMEQYLPTVVFHDRGLGGWPNQMNSEFLACTEPASLKESPLSARAFLLAVRGQLGAPDVLATLFPRLRMQNAGIERYTKAYLQQLTSDFPRLFYLFFEIGQKHGHFAAHAQGRIRWFPK